MGTILSFRRLRAVLTGGLLCWAMVAGAYDFQVAGIYYFERIAFLDCDNLQELTLPKHLTAIPEQMCASCKRLTAIRIPASVTTIDFHAFEDCPLLTAVTHEARTPITVEKRLIPTGDLFPNHSNISLLVPEGCKADYEADYYWKEFKEIVEYEEENRLCAAPTIAYDCGRLLLDCANPVEAECHAVITAGSTGEYSGNSIHLTPTYTITAWATAEGYADSPRVTATVGWRNGRPVMEGFSSVTLEGDGLKCDVNSDGTVDVADIATIIDKMAASARRLDSED